jgi:hypothetical protein
LHLANVESTIMTAVSTISASGEHLDASTLALLAEVELNEMSIRAFGEDLAADSEFSDANEPVSNPEALAADGYSTVYPWTTNGLLEAAKHLSACDSCGADRAAVLRSLNAAWQDPSGSSVVDVSTMEGHIAAALGAFDETIAPAVAPKTSVAKGEQRESAGFLAGSLGRGAKPSAGAQGSSASSNTSGWRASGFGRAIGLRRNQVLIGFASLAVAVPLLLQLRPTEQFGSSSMKTADTTAAAAQETAAAAEFAADTQAVAETTAAMAAETASAAASDVLSYSTDSLSRVPAAELNQALEPAAAPAPAVGVAPPVPLAPSNDAAVAETEAASAALEVDTADNAVAAPNAAAPNAAAPAVAAPAAPRVTAPLVVVPSPATVLASPLAAIPSIAAVLPSQPRMRSKDSAEGGANAGVASSVGSVSSDSGNVPTPSSVARLVPKTSTKTSTKSATDATAKAAAKAKRAPTKAIPATAAPSAAAPAVTASASGPELLDPSVLNLGNVGSEADPTALVGRFRLAYDRARPQSAATVALSPAATSSATVPSTSVAAPVTPAAAPAQAVVPAAAAAAPAVAPAPAVAVGADPEFGEPGTPSTLAPQTVERCVTAVFGPADRRIVAAASGVLGSRKVWVVRVEAATGTFDVILNAASCAELLRQPLF